MHPLNDQQAVLARATGYPYALPHQSFVYHAGKPKSHQRVHDARDFPDVSGRTPVLAVGSNQSPEQLVRKFPDPDWGQIPTSRVHLTDFDTVYSAHVTSYGSIAATLHPTPGTCVSLYVNWLTEPQLKAMHETELPNENYQYGRLENIKLRTEAGPALSAVNLYMSKRGAYAPTGNIIPLAEVPAQGRVQEAKTQTEILSLARDQLAPELGLEHFIFSAISNSEKRQTYIEALGKTVQKFESLHYASCPQKA